MVTKILEDLVRLLKIIIKKMSPHSYQESFQQRCKEQSMVLSIVVFKQVQLALAQILHIQLSLLQKEGEVRNQRSETDLVPQNKFSKT